MKRFVTYLYEYEKEIKIKNTGFVRVDIREPFVNIEVCVRKFSCEGEVGCVYVLVARRGLYGIEVGKINVQNGQGNFHLKLLAKNLQETGYAIDDVAGIGVCFQNKSYLATCWKDVYAEAIGKASFDIWKKEISQQKFLEKDEGKRAFIKESAKLEQNPKVTSEKISMTVLEKSDFHLQVHREELGREVRGAKHDKFLCDSSTSIEDFRLEENAESHKDKFVKGDGRLEQQDEIENGKKQENATKPHQKEDSKNYETSYTYQKIDLPQLRELPGQNIHYERNAFLIHGFWNYGYLILKTKVEEDKKTISLGVPGIYERQEATMAIVFGFSKFETIPERVITTQTSQKLSFAKEEIEEKQQPKEKTFGCWFTPFLDE